MSHTTQTTLGAIHAMHHGVRSNVLGLVNATLMIGTLILVGAYVVLANSASVNTWKVADANTRISQLSDERNTIIAQQASIEDRAQLLVLAEREGMVPANSLVYILEERSVAAR